MTVQHAGIDGLPPTEAAARGSDCEGWPSGDQVPDALTRMVPLVHPPARGHVQDQVETATRVHAAEKSAERTLPTGRASRSPRESVPAESSTRAPGPGRVEEQRACTGRAPGATALVKDAGVDPCGEATKPVHNHDDCCRDFRVPPGPARRDRSLEPTRAEAPHSSSQDRCRYPCVRPDEPTASRRGADPQETPCATRASRHETPMPSHLGPTTYRVADDSDGPPARLGNWIHSDRRRRRSPESSPEPERRGRPRHRPDQRDPGRGTDARSANDGYSSEDGYENADRPSNIRSPRPSRARSTQNAPYAVRFTGQKLHLPTLWNGRNYTFREFQFGLRSQLSLLNVPDHMQVLVMGQVLTDAAYSTYYTYVAGRLDSDDGYGTLREAMEHLQTTFAVPMEGLRGRRQLEQLRLSELTPVALQTFCATFSDLAANITPRMGDVDLLKTFLDVIPDTLREQIEKRFPETLDSAFKTAQQVTYILESKGRYTGRAPTTLVVPATAATTAPTSKQASRCTTCSRTGHTADRCHQRDRATAPIVEPPSKPFCTYCNFSGHTFDNCRNKLRGTTASVNTSRLPPSASAPSTQQGSDTRKCFNCNRVGHLSAACSEPRRPQQDQDPGRRDDRNRHVNVVVSRADDQERPDHEQVERPTGTNNTPDVVPMLLVDASGVGPDRGTLRLLVDTGCEVSLISPAAATRLRLTHVQMPPLHLFGISGAHLTTTTQVTTDLCFGPHMLREELHVVELGEFDGILGTSFLRRNNVLLDMGGHRLIIPVATFTVDGYAVEGQRGPIRQIRYQDNPVTSAAPAPALLLRDPDVGDDESTQPIRSARVLFAQALADGQFMVDAPDIDFDENDPLPPTVDLSKLTDLQQTFKPVADLLHRYSDVLGFSMASLREAAYLTPVRLVLKNAAQQPIRQAQYRRSHAERLFLEKETESLLDAGIIRRSESPWDSPTMVVPKPDGVSLRVVVDLRALNEVLVHDAAPVPRVDDVIDAISDGRPVQIFTKIDLQRGYWQIPLDEASAPLTAFSTPTGHFEYVRLPMGLQMAPAAFNREISIIFQSLPWVSHYFDDVYFASVNMDEHRIKLEQVLALLREFNLKLNITKSLFAVSEVPILGYHLDAHGLRPDPGKVAALRAHAETPPRTVKELQSFLGSINYYAKLIRDCAAIAAPLYGLCRKDADYHWSESCDASYRRLIDILTSAPVLRLPDASRPYTIFTDASGLAVGAVLSQMGSDGQEHPVAYSSRTLNKYEKNYGITEQECLAVVWAVKTFRVYIHDTAFTVVTDHSALQWLMSLRDPVGRLARWGLYLQHCKFKIVYRPGKQHANADLLSRPLMPPTFDSLPPGHEGGEMTAATMAAAHDMRTSSDTVTTTMADHLAALSAGASDDRGGRSAVVMAVLRSQHIPRPTPATPSVTPATQPRRATRAGVSTAESPDKHVFANETPADPDEPPVDPSDRRINPHDVTDDPAFRHFVQYGRHYPGQSRKQVARLQHLARHYVWADGMLQQDGARGRRIVPPTEHRLQLTQQAHYTGHFGARTTYERLQERYTWPSMLADATAVAHTCPICRVRAPEQRSFTPQPSRSRRLASGT